MIPNSMDNEMIPDSITIRPKIWWNDFTETGFNFVFKISLNESNRKKIPRENIQTLIKYSELKSVIIPAIQKNIPKTR